MHFNEYRYLYNYAYSLNGVFLAINGTRRVWTGVIAHDFRTTLLQQQQMKKLRENKEGGVWGGGLALPRKRKMKIITLLRTYAQQT